MKITILQRNIEWANPQANIARADEAISCLPDADLFVLPEMFSTGFCTQPEGIAESADSETLHCSPLGANTSVSLPAQSVWW